MDPLQIKEENRGRPSKPLSKEKILFAIANTQSNKAAARWLGVSYIHYKKWAKAYKNSDGITLFDQHKNQSGKGIKKFWSTGGRHGDPDIVDIMEGRVDPNKFHPIRLKNRLINEGYLAEKCAGCNFDERRVLDYKMPLLLHFKDNNKKNWRHENLELLCYNCFFLTVGDIFTKRQIEVMVDHKPESNFHEVDWDLDKNHQEMLKKLDMENIIFPTGSKEDSIISYI